MLSPGAITNAVPDPDEAIRLQRDIQRTAQENASARSLQQSQIGAGGLLINGGGSLTIAGTGSLNVGSGALNSAGSISAGTTVSAGTDITASGNITAGGTMQGGTVNSTGAMNASGDVTASGRLIGTAGVRSPGARANVLTTWIAAQIDPAGNFGIVSSSVDVKQDFEPVDMSGEVAAIFSAALIQFRYIEHVAEYGDDAPVMLGSLAQYFESIGLGRYVTRNLAGEVDGIQYAELVKPLMAAVQDLNQRLLSQDARIAALEAAQPTQTA